MALALFVEKKYSILLVNTFSGAILLIIIFAIFIIRYNKITDYNKIEKRLKNLSKTKQLILNIFAVIYILIAIPGFFILAILIGESANQ